MNRLRGWNKETETTVKRITRTETAGQKQIRYFEGTGAVQFELAKNPDGKVGWGRITGLLDHVAKESKNQSLG